MAPILTIFGPNRSRRHRLFFQKICASERTNKRTNERSNERSSDRSGDFAENSFQSRRYEVSIHFSTTWFFLFDDAKISEMIASAVAIDSVKKSSKSEPSSRFFGRLKFRCWRGPRRDGGPKKTKNSKCVSYESSGHDDQNAYWIIKIGAILGG